MLTRRSTILGICAAGLPWPAPPAAAGTIRKPPRLKQGDHVGLVAPAMFADNVEAVRQIEQTIRGMGLVPRPAPHLTARYGYLAGTDHQRADDLNAMYADDEIRAVFAIMGGWGSARILPLLDWDLIRAHPKLLVGSSDITALHLAFAARAGFPTIHATNAAYNWYETSWTSFWRLAFAGETPVFANPDLAGMDEPQAGRWRITTIREGRASGRLVGGNLSVLAAMLGTPWMPDCEGAILFLEDAGEAEYRIDRMLTQLGQAGILGQVAGVMFGQCTHCTGGIAGYSGFTIAELLRQHLQPLGIPAFSGANIGHVSNQLSVPCGARVTIDAGLGTITVLEPVCA